MPAVNQKKDAALIPSQGTCWVAGQVPGFGVCERQPTDVSLTYQCFPPSLPPSLPLSMKITTLKKKYCKNLSQCIKGQDTESCLYGYKTQWLPWCMSWLIRNKHLLNDRSRGHIRMAMYAVTFWSWKSQWVPTFWRFCSARYIIYIVPKKVSDTSYTSSLKKSVLCLKLSLKFIWRLINGRNQALNVHFLYKLNFSITKN